MTKKYSVPKNRWLTILLINVPYPAEPRDETPRQRSKRVHNAMAYTAMMVALAPQFYEGKKR